MALVSKTVKMGLGLETDRDSRKRVIRETAKRFIEYAQTGAIAKVPPELEKSIPIRKSDTKGWYVGLMPPGDGRTDFVGPDGILTEDALKECMLLQSEMLARMYVGLGVGKKRTEHPYAFAGIKEESRQEAFFVEHCGLTDYFVVRRVAQRVEKRLKERGKGGEMPESFKALVKEARRKGQVSVRLRVSGGESKFLSQLTRSGKTEQVMIARAKAFSDGLQYFYDAVRDTRGLGRKLEEVEAEFVESEREEEEGREGEGEKEGESEEGEEREEEEEGESEEEGVGEVEEEEEEVTEEEREVEEEGEGKEGGEEVGLKKGRRKREQMGAPSVSKRQRRR